MFATISLEGNHHERSLEIPYRQVVGPQKVPWNTAVQFYAANSGVRKNFDLKSIRVIKGPIQIVGYRTDVGWWQWFPLTPGTLTFYNANNLSEMTVYHNDKVNTYEVDDISLAVHY